MDNFIRFFLNMINIKFLKVLNRPWNGCLIDSLSKAYTTLKTEILASLDIENFDLDRLRPNTFRNETVIGVFLRTKSKFCCIDRTLCENAEENFSQLEASNLDSLLGSLKQIYYHNI